MSEPTRTDASRRLRPVERFLGAAEAAGGPFALLALTPAECSEDDVLSALDRQIERVATHAECDTPEADEVRLALHAAAAQLLDPIVRRHLIAKWTGVPLPSTRPASPPRPPVPPPVAPPPASPTPAAASQAPARTPAAAPVTHHRVPAQKLLEHDAILTLGLFGGWNQRSLRRLMSLAAARGFTNEQVAATLHGLSSRRRATSRPAPKAAPRPRARLHAGGAVSETVVVAAPAVGIQVQTDPGQALVRNAVLIGGAVLFGLLLAVVAIIALTGPTPPPAGPVAKAPPSGTTGPVPAPTGPAEAVAAKATPQPEPPPAAPATPADMAAVAREIAASVEALQVDAAEAGARLERGIGALAAGWPRAPRDRLVAAHDAIVEFLYRAGSTPDVQMRAVEAIGRGAAAMAAPGMTAEGVLPAVWSTGMVVRLSRERDLPSGAKGLVESLVSGALGQTGGVSELTFEAGAAAALALLPQRLTPAAGSGARAAVDLDAWRNWAQAVEARAGADAAMAQRLLLAGIETLLIQGPEPNENKGIAEAVSLLVIRLRWGSQDETRRWLLRWFEDRRITAADLHAVTSVLAGKSSAEGVDITMVLSTSASDKTRADLRDRYATVWNIQRAVDRDKLTAAWIKAAREAIERSLSGGGDIEQLASAALLARVSESAAWQWRGDGGAAAALVADLVPPVDQAMAPVQQGPVGNALELTDGGWGEKYLAAKANTKLKREMIEQLSNSVYELGPVDAEILVREAILGSPTDLRLQAQEAVKKLSGTASVINALLEQLPRVQRLASTAALVEWVCQKQLPALRDPDWPMAARRALVERLLEAIAAESPMARVDRLATLVSTSYRAMAAPAPLAPDQRAAKSQPPAHLSAAQVWARWRSAADALVPTSPPPMRLDQIERRRAGRLSQAKGMVQLFAAEQTSICEVMAYVVAAELPDRGDRVREVLDRLAGDRRRAGSILEQLNATERAIVELWLIRFQEEPA